MSEPEYAETCLSGKAYRPSEETTPYLMDAPIALKRSRAGCQSCRLRRRKCDGGRPVCNNCSKKNSACVWGLKASFHPSRLVSLSISEEQALRTIENERRRNEPDERKSTAPIIDNTLDVVRSYRKRSLSAYEVSGPSEEISDDFVEDDHNRERMASQGERSDPIQLDSSVLSTINGDLAPEATMGAVLYSAMTTEWPSRSQVDGNIAIQDTGTDGDMIFAESFTPPFSLGLALSRKSSPFREPEFPIDESKTLMLVRSFLSEGATWCETTDTGKQFSVVCAHDMLEHKIFKASALALACRQLSVTGFPVEDVALQLYQYTIRLLIQQNPDQADAFILAACVLLCVYEMIASEVVDWRRHLKGCAGLLSSKKWNGSSTGLIKTCFWAFARIDLWAAFILGKRTLIPTNSWVADESLQTASIPDSPDDYCNLCILAFARVVNCLGKDETGGTTPESSPGLQRLWRRLQEWWNLRPKRARALYRLGPTSSNPFPTIVFTYAAAICGNTFYHSGCLLLLNKLGVEISASTDPEKIDPVWHAKELCGISISDKDHANWVNHLQPLYIAGEVFGPPPQRRTSRGALAYDPTFGIANDRAIKRSSPGTRSGTVLEPFNDNGEDQGEASSQFAAEQIAILKHLVRIQRETGWKTESRAQDLRVLWGLE